MRYKLPHAARGQTIGLLGGSFDPAHEGHAHISHEALKRFNLDQIWWLVSPQNPLKKRRASPLLERVRRAQDVSGHPKIKVTTLETTLSTYKTIDSLEAIKAKYRQANFIWLMGADNLKQFDQWYEWRKIAEVFPIGILARPEDRLCAKTSKSAKVFASSRIAAQKASVLKDQKAPAWCFLNISMKHISSTQIREASAKAPRK